MYKWDNKSWGQKWTFLVFLDTFDPHHVSLDLGYHCNKIGQRLCDCQCVAERKAHQTCRDSIYWPKMSCLKVPSSISENFLWNFDTTLFALSVLKLKIDHLSLEKNVYLNKTYYFHFVKKIKQTDEYIIHNDSHIVGMLRRYFKCHIYWRFYLESFFKLLSFLCMS